MSRRLKIVLALGILVLIAVTGAGLALTILQSKLNNRLEKGWVIPPLELYSQGFALSTGRKFPLAAIQDEFSRRGLQIDRDYLLGPVEICARATGIEFHDNSQQCLFIKTEKTLAAWDADGFVQELWRGEPLAVVNSAAVFPRLITQFFDGQPIQQQNTPLAEVPLVCLQAVTAIEDRDFLEHGGVSATGTLRALLRNLRAGRFAEGGSTITQQLVKNFVLSSKKTIQRKLEEQALALMLESQLSKDQILEMYLNVIYMGQNGPYQVRGLGSASNYYFDKPVAQLDLAQCALLAALINNPGRYSPFAHADHASARRELVLRKMVDAQMISEEEMQTAVESPLPKTPEPGRRAHAPYFVMTALKEFAALGIDAEEGARLYTTLDPDLHAAMASAVQAQLPAIEKRVRKPPKEPLQVAAVTVDLQTAQVLALIGGRDFRATQFNRAMDSRRQIGSTIKPFVYLPAMREHDPLTALQDEPFEWVTGKQVWKPRNYDGKTHGTVPYFYALAESLNIPAAHVGQDVGLDKVADTLRAAGIGEKIPLVPSLTLGVLELSPLDVAQAYTSLARLGPSDQVHTLIRVEDLKGELLFEHRNIPDFGLDPALSAVVVGMLEQTFSLGTARAARAQGLEGTFAGKTGTTSDTKDAWFAGFSPRLLTVVWVGYDNNAVMGLTGGGAALPIWLDLTKNIQKKFRSEDFKWPESVRVRDLSGREIREKFPSLPELPETVKLVFPRD